MVRAGHRSVSRSTLGKVWGNHSTAHGPGGMNMRCMSTQRCTAFAGIGRETGIRRSLIDEFSLEGFRRGSSRRLDDYTK